MYITTTFYAQTTFAGQLKQRCEFKTVQYAIEVNNFLNRSHVIFYIGITVVLLNWPKQ